MDIATVQTIISIIPTEKPHEREYVRETFIPHTVTAERRFQDYQLTMTVDNKTSTFVVDQVTSRLGEETTTLVDAALSGYNATYLCLSVSDEYKESIYKQRQQNLKDLFDTLTLRLQHNSFSIEYAYLGIKDNACYDMRKKTSRTNLSVLKRGMDDFMKSVDSVEEIITMLEKEPVMPSILHIKFTQERITGRLVIVDLLHARFTPLLPGITHPIHASFDDLQCVVEKWTTRDCNEEIKTNTSVLTNEIGKYLCGHNKLLVVGYIHDTVVNDIHANETRSLLSFVSSFKNMPVRSLPNKTLTDTSEYKHLLSEKKTLEHQHSQLVALQFMLQQQIRQKNYLVKDMTSYLDSLKSESTQEHVKAQEEKEKSAFVHVKETQVNYLKSTLGSKISLYAFETLQLKADIVRLNTMLDIKEFAEQDIISETQSKKRRYTDHIDALQDKLSDHEKQLEQLKQSIDTLPQDPQHTEKSNRLQELKTTLEKRKKLLQENEQENATEKTQLDAKYQRHVKSVERNLIYKKKQVKQEITAVKENANNMLNAINRQYQDKIADQEKEIENLRQQLIDIHANKNL